MCDIQNYIEDVKLARRFLQHIRANCGERCEVKDTDEFPEILVDPVNNTRCAVCEAYEHADWIEGLIEDYESELVEAGINPEDVC